MNECVSSGRQSVQKVSARYPSSRPYWTLNTDCDWGYEQRRSRRRVWGRRRGDITLTVTLNQYGVIILELPGTAQESIIKIEWRRFDSWIYMYLAARGPVNEPVWRNSAGSSFFRINSTLKSVFSNIFLSYHSTIQKIIPPWGLLKLSHFVQIPGVALERSGAPGRSNLLKLSVSRHSLRG